MKRVSLFGALALLCSGALAQQTIDGTADYQYSAPIVCQNVQTGFGDNLSELDVAYSYIKDGVLYLTLAGNLENNSNKLNIFVDSVSGGQNRLRGDNWKDFVSSSWYLTRLGDSGGPNGLKFEAGFTADHYFGINRNGGNLYLDYSATPDTANNIGFYLGQSNLTDGTLSGGTNLYGIKANYDGSNTAGTGSGSATGYALGGTVKTGFEMSIPLAAIGNPTGTIRICAFVGNSDNSFLSNQFLPGVGYNGGTVNNYGEPRGVDLGGTGSNLGTQYLLAPYSSTGNLVASKNLAGTTAMAAVAIEELTGSGSLIQTFFMPTSASGAQKAFTVSGSATSEGHLTRSADGRTLLMAGYNAVPGVANVNGSLWTANNRVIATVSSTGAIDTSTALTDGTGAIRSATGTEVSSSTSKLWIGTANHSRFTTLGATTSSLLTSATYRVVNTFNNQLYVSTNAAISSIGPGLPEASTTGTVVVSPLTSAYDFYFADAVTLYVADDGMSGGIRKLHYVGGVWTARYTINTGFGTSTGCRSVTGTLDSSGNVVLYAVVTDNTVRSIVDTPTATSNPNNPWTTIATGNSSNIYRGVDLSIFPANSAPVLTVPADSSIAEGMTYGQTATATDPDAGQTKTFSKVSGPAGLTVSSGGAISWPTVEADGPGTYAVTIKVEDNGTPVLSDTKTFNITVEEVNQPPTLVDPADHSVDENTLDSVTLSGSDPDLPAQTLEYTLLSGPGFVTGNTWSWTPSEADGPGDFVVIVQVDDLHGGTAQQSFTVHVNEANEDPTLNNPGTQSATEHSAFSVQLTGSDTDLPGQPLTYGLVAGPSGLTVGGTGLVEWTPGESDGGTSPSVTVSLSDGTATVQQTFTINVAETNEIPVLADPADGSVNEGVLDTRVLSATDDDLPAQTLTYSLVSGPGSVTGNTWSWTPGESDGGGTFTVTVKVEDDFSPVGSHTQSFQVTVNETNQAPVLTDPADHSVNEGVLDSVTLSASDADVPVQTLTYAWVSGPGSVTGNTWSWTPGETDGPGVYPVTVSVTDGTDTVQQTFQVTVNEVNQPPVLDDPADQNIDEMVLSTVALNATDADLPTQTLTYAKVSGPGAVSGNSWTWTPSEADGPGTYTVVVSVTDGIDTVQQSFEVNVAEANVAPILAAIGNQSVDELQTLSFTATATDADVPAQTLHFSLAGDVPAGATITDGGVFSWTPTEAQGPGTYTFDVVVKDFVGLVDGGQDSETITVTVDEVNVAPVLNAVGNQSVDELAELSFTATASDSDLPEQTLTFSLSGAPQGAAISPSGVFTWTPTEAQGPGVFTFDVVVSDGTVTDSETITVTVAEVNVDPTLPDPSGPPIPEGDTFTTQLLGEDTDVPTQTLSYSKISGPAALTVSPTGAVSWLTTEADGPGTYPVTVEVTDGAGGSAQRTFDIVVEEVNVAPVLGAIGNQSGTTENLITFTAAATDADIPANTLTFSLDSGAPAGASITSGGVFTWTPTNAQTGDFTVTVRVTDNGSPVLDDFETITIHVDASNTAPVADAQSVSTPKNTPKPIMLTATDTDVPAQTLSYTVINGPDHGVLLGTEPNLVYTPNVNYVGPDSFTFKANDGLVDSNVATVTIDVTQTPSMVISVYGSPAPNAFGSPSWPQYIANALTALEAGVSSVGDRNTDPSAYVQVTDVPWSDAVVAGFSSWRGVAGPLPPFDQEGGNRLHFGLRIQGNGTRFTLQDLEFAVHSDDPADDLEFVGDFVGANYSSTRKGIDYGPDRVKGTLDDITYTTGGGTSYVDEIIYVGVGNAWDASFETGTDQEKLEAVRCYLENMAPIHVLAEYKIKDGNGGYFATGSTVVTIIPTNSLPVANGQTVDVNEDSFVGITLTATDADNETLSYTVVDGPDHGTLSGTAPNLTYTPFPNYFGPDSFTFKATDCVGDSNIATVTINVANMNDDPILGAVGNKVVDEHQLLTFSLSSSDIDGGAPIYSMIGGPVGATLVGNTFSWTPSEAQGPDVYSVTFEVSDGAGGVDSETISITVNEVNEAPVLGAIGTQAVDELQLLSFNAAATDPDLPANGLTYSLEGAVPPGATITSGGAFSWTPTEAQGAGSYTFDVVVKDNGSPQMEDRETITINVNEVNVAPELAAIGNQTVDEMSLLTFTATATDADLPANTLTFSLDPGAPAGASITSAGVFTWTPTEAQGPGVYSIAVRVTDNGSPALNDFETIQVTVNEVPDAVSMTLNLSVPGFAGGGNVIRGVEIRVGGSGGVNAPVSLDRDVTFDASGNATIVLTEADGLTAGAAYTFVSVKDPLHTIRRKIALNEASTDTYDATLSLISGNMNKDNKVDIGDYVILALRYGTSVVPDTPFDIPGNPPTHTPTFRHADLNGDGDVAIDDYAILSANFGTVGDAEVDGYGRENNQIRRKISVLDAILEAGTSEVVKFDKDADGWITFDELGFHP